MKRKRVLWLCSWYPNANDSFDGDFIQRQAIAAAAFDDIDVIYVGVHNSGTENGDHSRPVAGLNEYRYYLAKDSSFPGHVAAHLRWYKSYKNIIKKHMAIHGLPALVHLHIPWKAGLLALWLRRKYELSYFLSEHWTVYDMSQPDNFHGWPLLRQIITKKVFRRAREVISVSLYLSKAIEVVTGVSVKHIIPNVVDTSSFYFQQKKDAVFTFIHVSNMAGFKNVSGIITAFAMAKETLSGPCQLILVGNPGNEHEKTAEDTGLLNTSIFFHGELPYSCVAELVRRSHVSVLFSDTETFSCVTAEALCAGVPVLARSVAAIPELVNDGNGLLVSSDQMVALAGGFIEIRNNYSRYDLAGISLDACERFNYRRVGEQFNALYNDA